MLASGRTGWRVGDRVRVYRTRTGSAVAHEGTDGVEQHDARDYDASYYARLLRETFVARLARAFTPGDFDVVFADPDQVSLFDPPLSTIRSVLTTLRMPED